MKDYVFEKEIFHETSYIKISFKAKEKHEKIDYLKLESLCNDYFKKDILTLSANTLVSHIRTIFNDFDETDLSIEFKQGYKSKYSLQYIDKKLISFDVKNKEQENTIYLNYSLLKGLKFDIEKNNLLEYNSDKINYEKIFSKYLSYLYSLKNVNSVSINKEAKELCEIYKLFYGDYPNFNSRNINIKMQTLIYVLSEFGIVFSNEYKFNNINKNKIPHSEKIYDIIENMKPYGKVKGFNDILIDRKRKEIIEIINDTIKKTKGKEMSLEQVMIYISSVMYVIRNCMTLGYKEEEVKEYLNYSNFNTEKSIKIYKILSKNIYERN